MAFKNTDATSNDDNIFLRRLYLGKDERGDFRRRLAYKPIFLRLVEKYIKKPFKSFPHSTEFQSAEQLVILFLDLAIDFYENDDIRTASWPLEIIARELEISVVQLYNDEEFIASLKKAQNTKIE